MRLINQNQLQLVVCIALFTGLSQAKYVPMQSKAGCAFNLGTSSPSNPPQLIHENNQEVINPVLDNGVRVIYLDVGQPVKVACVGTGNSVSITGQQVHPAVCTANSRLLLTDVGQEVAYNELGCKQKVKEVLVEIGSCAANGVGTLIRAGWQVDSDLVRIYDMCHDKVKLLNYYSIDVIPGRSAEAKVSGNSRPAFSQGDYYPGIDVNTQYTQVTQTATVAQIVGSAELAAHYIDSQAQFFFSRGHMAPNADFIDEASQDSSFYFTNVAPQFQSFNGQNWATLEAGSRNLAIQRDINLTVYTGTFGIVTLADINGVQQPIYLAFDNTTGLIPAPLYYWKLVHDPAANTATAIVGINNPWLNPVPSEAIFCPSVCQQIPWVNAAVPQLTNIVKGYTFCCTAADLRKVVDFAPDLDVPLLI